ncbi:MAG: M3 family metallopeptidase [Rikenellaceae bacterium]
MRRFHFFISALLLMTLSLSCNTKVQEVSNPLLSEWDTPFGAPPFEEIKPQHYMPAFEVAMEEHNAEIEEIIKNSDDPSFENVILAYDNSGKLLWDIYNIFGMISAAETNEELQAINEEFSPIITAHVGKIGLNEELFTKIQNVYDKRKTLGLDAEQLRLTEKIYNSFVRSGALLHGEAKERMQAINEELALLEVRFGQNLLAENNNFRLELSSKDLNGLPEGVRNAAKEAGEALGLENRWVITLQAPSWIPFMTYSTKRDLREKLYKAYISRGNNNDELDNKQIINDMARLRSEKAQLLGFSDYADYVISDQMAKKTSKVYALLDEIWTPALESSKAELEELNALFEKQVPGETFQSWDWWYYSELVRKDKYALDEEMLRPYFSLQNVQSGIFMLANRLYGVTFRPVAVPHYHSECVAFEVIDVDNSHLGLLYFDYHPRAGKSQGAWCGNYREQRYENGERVAPIVSIVCNFTRPSGKNPALLSLDETETLFHEFGHALHFLFHDVKYRGLTEVEGDFVELPSQIMENWAFEPALLEKYAFHHRTNKVIPENLIQKLRRSTLFNQGFMTTELTAAALSDLDVHSIKAYTPFDVEAYEKSILNEQRGLITEIEPRYHYTYFSHIFDGGYSAGYYFYLWAEVLDQDAFSAFKESGDLFNKRLADSFRRNVLERGGSEDGMVMYKKFRGAEPNKDAMLYSRGLKEREVEEEELLDLEDESIEEEDAIDVKPIDTLNRRTPRAFKKSVGEKGDMKTRE